MSESRPSPVFYRSHELNNGKVLKIHQLSFGDVGCVVWDAALVLAKYLESKEICTKLQGKRILELGAGTGFVGLVAACLGASVRVTDLPEFIDLMETNIRENAEHMRDNRIHAAALVWGDMAVEGLPHYDYILVSDCIYYTESTDPLVRTLTAHCDADCEILMSYEKRLTGDKPRLEHEFFQLMDRDFTKQEVPTAEQDPVFRSDDIRIVKFRRR